MYKLLAVLLFVAVAYGRKYYFNHQPLSDDLITHINNLHKQGHTTWVAGKNFEKHGMTTAGLKRMCGVLDDPNGFKLPFREPHVITEGDIPDEFDARKQWPKCKSISTIRDQGNCGSCWAFGAVESMSDRICISSDGAMQPSISAEDLLSCCWSCGMGCNGVYQHETGGELGGHAIRILGWGTENDTPYWLVANSWNNDWGASGYFKILRGQDECGIESSIAAGLPK
ncbi:CTSB [Bugula neritina]|uniref:CTSB n=1 Tax=Bugula neritina TaxID=10212 RepID=A0A7J7KFP3_BUGNE|nr:CTSB [Bugula neritina]